MKKLHDYGLGKLNRVDIEQLSIELEAMHMRCGDMYFDCDYEVQSDDAIELLNTASLCIRKSFESLDAVLKLIRMRDAAHIVDRLYLAKLRKKQRLRRRKMNGSNQAPAAVQARGGLVNTHRRGAAPKSAALFTCK